MVVARKLLCVNVSGTLIENTSANDFPRSPKDVGIISGVPETIQKYSEDTWQIVGYSNQAGVAQKKLSFQNCLGIMKKTLNELPALTCIYFCTDWAGEQCYRVNRDRAGRLFPESRYLQEYRYPYAGMVYAAIDRYASKRSFELLIVGDSPDCEKLAGKVRGNYPRTRFMYEQDWYLKS